HPIAGTEQSGPAAALATLYQQQRVVLTPGEDADQQAVTIIEAMWQAAGAEVVRLSVAQHDAMLAATSHLPHILAFNLVSLLAQGPDADDVLNYAAGGFRDFSRIASSHPAMWRDICLTNREAILPILADYQQQLTHIKTAIEQQQGEALLTLFEQAKQMRDARFLAEK
ncbi:MAG TPA: prephenate dehydrogenase/arogenate dehydrogenase family protein, partial [Gammaproteobacteria bacterium]|nr:prephenate dehydrogenase/arogenate dehydrogenase family protein [Gammaproteobacteria bacterium]